MAVVVRTLSKDDVSETAGRIRREIADHKRHRLAREELRLFRKAMAVAYQPRAEHPAHRHGEEAPRAAGDAVSRFLCWNCGLWQGDESDPIEASRLCDTCRAAMRDRRRPTVAAPGPEVD